MANTFTNDGSFMEQFLKKQKLEPNSSTPTINENKDTHFDAATYYNQYGGVDPNANMAYYNQYYQQQQQPLPPGGSTTENTDFNSQYYNQYYYGNASQAGGVGGLNSYQQPQQTQQYNQQTQQYNQQGQSGGQYPGQLQPTKVLWAGNVHPDVMDEELKQIFSPFGYIENLKILRNKQYAFITYSDTASAIKAQAAINNQVVRGYPLKLGFGKNIESTNPQAIIKKEDDIPTKNLWLGNVHANVTNDMLKQLFDQFGRIEGIHILSNRGCAFVNFQSVDASMNARQVLNGHVLCGLPLKINFRKENEHFSNRGGGGGDFNDRGPNDRFNRGGGERFNRGGNDGGSGDQLPPRRSDRPDRPDRPDRSDRPDRPHRPFPRGETVPLPAPPPSSHKEQQAIDTIAEFIAKNGPKLESMMMERQSGNNFFNFLRTDQPNHDYYRWKLWTIKNPDTHSTNNNNNNNNSSQQQQENQITPQFPSNYLNELQVSEFKSILEKLNSSNISSCKSWIMNHSPNALEIISIITTTHQNNPLVFQHKLNILQVLNDCLQSSSSKRENKEVLDEFSNTIKPYLPFLVYSTGSNESVENQDKIFKILSNWESLKIYSIDFIEELKAALQD